MIRSFSVLILVLTACGDPTPRPVDAHATVPRTAAGTFKVESNVAFTLPDAARPAILAIEAATDGPDDPSRYLVDAMVATLPDGTIANVAAAAAPYVAAYLNTRLASVAPRLAPGLAQLATGLAGIAQHLDSLETVQIASDGEMVRNIVGVRFAPGTQMLFADVGMPELAAASKVQLQAGTLEIAAHALALPYARLLRLGLDRGVAPSVVPGATDLASALSGLVDCTQIGMLVANEVEIGGAALYTTACSTAMVAIAAHVDAQLAAIGDAPLLLEVAGTGTGYDADGDGTMDAILDGAWVGQPGSAFAVAAGTFSGTR